MRNFCVFVLLLALVCTSVAQSSRRRSNETRTGEKTAEAQKEQKEKDELAAQLLARAAAISSQLSDSDRAYLLARLAQASSRKQPQQSAAWADEVFAVTAGLPAGGQRTQIEMTAVQASTESNPQHGLQLLGKMEGPPASEAGQPFSDMRPAAAMQVFQRYWQEKGVDGLDSLMSAAHKMGDSGAYPYLAIAPLVRQLKAKDPDRAQALITDALSFYARRQHSSMADNQFVMFLRQSQDLIPKPLMKDILQQLVKDNLDAAKDAAPINASVSDDSGRSVRINNASAMTLLSIIPLARNVDPEWAKKLEEQHSELKDMANVMASTSGGQRVNVGLSVGPDGKPNAPSAAMMDEMKSVQVDELSSRDPQGALKLSRDIQNPATRAAVDAQIGGELAKSDPDQSAALLKQAHEALAETKEPGEKLRIVVGLAQAQASMNDIDNFSESLSSAYTMGEEVFRRGVDKNPNAAVFQQPGFDSMSRLTHAAIKFNETETLAALESLRSPLLKAHLLLAAAEGLDPHSRMRRPGMRVVIED